MKSSEIKLGELLFFEEDKVFGVVYDFNDKGFYLVDWCDGFAPEEEYTPSKRDDPFFLNATFVVLPDPPWGT